MAYFYLPDSRQRAELEKEGFRRYGHVPFLLDNELNYLDDLCRFLRERAVGEWNPSKGMSDSYSYREPISENSIVAYARDLENFWTYVEATSLPWRTISYTGLLESYDTDLGNGRWSRSGNKLAASTINRRVDRAVEFLSWAAEKGIRQAFPVTTKTVSRSIYDGRSANPGAKSIEVRTGKRRIQKSQMRLPTRTEIDIWLSEIEVRRGKPLRLACETVIETGMRRQELILLRKDQLPDPEDVPLDKPAKMRISFGTKGKRRPGDGEQRGKARTLRFDRDFLVRLNNYKQLRRQKALATYSKRNPGKPHPKELFLDESTGEPFSATQIYLAWTRVKNLPFDGFSPHRGRHAFACFTLLRLLDEEAGLLEASRKTLPRSAVMQSAETLIKTYIQPALGHVSDQTTELYLEWIADHLWVMKHRLSWADELEGKNV